MGFQSEACVIIRNSRHGQTPVVAKECTSESRTFVALAETVFHTVSPATSQVAVATVIIAMELVVFEGGQCCCQ